jgi:hypothetical protein
VLPSQQPWYPSALEHVAGTEPPDEELVLDDDALALVVVDPVLEALVLEELVELVPQ